MAKVLERKPLTWAEKTYLPQILGGLVITLRRLFRPRVTLEYPEQRPELPAKYRGAPTLVCDQNGREKCVSCQMCEFVCPPKAIRITPGSIQNPAYAHVEKAPQAFEINMLRCIYCGLCEEVCPESAIILQKTFSLNGTKRADLVMDKRRLYEMGGTLPDSILKWDKKLAAAKAAEHSGH